jgi:hypothetical protein
MKYLITQPDFDYFIWQLKAQMYNFHCHGVEQDAIILLGYRKKINDNAIAFARKTKAHVFFYEDKRPSPIVYHPNIVPHLIKQHTLTEPFLYLGDDCLLTKLPAYPEGKKVYVANTASYIASTYIKKRSAEIFYKMCNIVGVDPEVVESNDENCGGAQYLFNVVPKAMYWSKVESDSEQILKLLETYNKKAVNRVQAWTAGMWAMLWNLWLFNIETETTKELDHAWPNYDSSELTKYNFFHNAGVTHDRSNVLFFKGAYRNGEPPVDLVFDDKYCSAWYYNQIKKGLEFFKQR